MATWTHDEPAPLIPALAGLHAWARALSWPLIRLFAGGALLQHGVVKLMGPGVAAFAAGVGGADAVTVIPFDEPLGLPDAFGRRIARNTSSLLIEESHLAVVADPAGGSYAVERLTDDLAVAGWEELGRIEPDGGFVLARDGVRHPQIGPLVAPDAATARSLLGAASAALAKPFLLDLRDEAMELASACEAAGGVRERPFTRMSLGMPVPGDATLCPVLAGPEFG